MPPVPKEVMDLYDDLESVKMLASVDKKKNLNVVLVGTVGVVDGQTLGFIDVFMDKTKQNLESTKRATISVFKPPTQSYQAKGIFQGWQTSGPAYDKLMAKYKDLLGDAPVRGVGLFKIDEVYACSPMAQSKKVV